MEPRRKQRCLGISQAGKNGQLLAGRLAVTPFLLHAIAAAPCCAAGTVRYAPSTGARWPPGTSKIQRSIQKKKKNSAPGPSTRHHESPSHATALPPHQRPPLLLLLLVAVEELAHGGEARPAHVALPRGGLGGAASAGQPRADRGRRV
jgi:hypothetical protein